MPRGYRRILLAAFVGLVVTALPAQHRDKHGEPQQANTNHQIADAANQISAAIQNTVQPTEGKGRCAHGKYEDDADLCAQWEAADASRDAADYAFWSMVIGAIGAGLLVWTLWDTRITSRAELRAYIDVSGAKLVQDETIAGPDQTFWHIRFKTKNFGQTPAFDVFVKSYVVVLARGKAPAHQMRGESDLGAVSAGDFIRHFAPRICITADDIDRIANGEAVYSLHYNASYRDAFGRKHTTSAILDVKPSYVLGMRERSHKMT